MSRYSQNFSLSQILNTRISREFVPYGKAEKSRQQKYDKNNTDAVVNTVFNVSTATAKAYYRPLMPSKSGQTINIKGTLVSDFDTAYNGICNAIETSKPFLTFNETNSKIFEMALQEEENNKRKYGISNKLYLRVKSMQALNNMTMSDLKDTYNNVLENIIFGDDFPETQKKLKLGDLFPNGNYAELQKQWQIKVGDI